MRPPLILIAGFGGFLAVVGYLVASSLTARRVASFAPRPVVRQGAPGLGGGPDTLTIDASDADHWVFVDLDRGTQLALPDTAGWDLAIRRYRIIASREIADLGPGAFDSLARPPASGYIPNAMGSDTTNPAIGRWYSYSLFSHLLMPKGHRYVVLTSERRFAKLELISYYCPGLKAGCLTLRYGFLR